MRTRFALIGAVVVGLAVAAGVFARAQVPPDPLQQATADGCERNDTTLHTLDAPNWVYVNDKDFPASGPPPAFRSLDGVVQHAAADVHASDGDNPVSHTAYDLTFDVDVDAADRDLVAQTNTSGGLHVEREESTAPPFVWPEPGDRVTMRGYWVWDCDHYTTNGEVTGEQTEMHPWLALWVRRAESALSPTGAAEADLYLTNDRTEAGKHADCAHLTKGGRAQFKTCVLGAAQYVDMSGSYAFPLPARGRVRVVDMGSVAAPPLHIAGGKLTFVLPKPQARHPRQVIAVRVFVARKSPPPEHLSVTFDSVLIRRSMDPGCIPKAPVGCGTPETTQDDQVTHGPTGEWNFYSDVAGVWSLWTPHVWRVGDGQAIRPGKTFRVWLPRARPWRVFLWTRECDWGTLARGGSGALSPCPKQPEVGDRAGDDVPGAALAVFRSPAAALGTHTVDASLAGSTCPPVNRNGCYSVTFTVRRLPH